MRTEIVSWTAELNVWRQKVKADETLWDAGAGIKKAKRG